MPWTAEQLALIPRQIPRPVKLLLVEDSESDAYFTARMLRHSSPGMNFHITHTPRLSSAFEICDRQHFDIALLDLHLPDMCGSAAVAALHAQIPETPIIVYSNTADPQQRGEALMCGAVHFLVKGRESAWSLQHILQQAIDGASPALDLAHG